MWYLRKSALLFVSSEMRTQVIDDESDYFSVNSVWLSPRQREELKKKEEEMQALKHRSQKSKVYTLDMGCKFVIYAVVWIKPQ